LIFGVCFFINASKIDHEHAKGWRYVQLVKFLSSYVFDYIEHFCSNKLQID